MILLLLACAKPVATEPAAAPRPHGLAALGARDALVMSDRPAYERAIAALRRDFPLADHPAGPQAPLLDALVRAAEPGRMDGADLGAIGVACGSCHAATGAAVPGPDVARAAGDGVRAEMARHDRALGLVWSGLVRPSADDLRAGADAFRASTLAPVSGMAPEVATGLDTAVTEAATALAGAADPATRAGHFGAIVGTCAACHQAPPEGLIEPE